MRSKTTATASYVLFLRYRELDIEGKPLDFGHVKVFDQHPQNPILDREAAFAYRDWLIVKLLEAKGVKAAALSDLEKRKALQQHYFNPSDEAMQDPEPDREPEKPLKTPKSTSFFMEAARKFKERKTKLMPLPFLSEERNRPGIPDNSLGWYPKLSNGLFVVFMHNDKEAEVYADQPEDDWATQFKREIIDRVTAESRHYAVEPPPPYQSLANELAIYNKHKFATQNLKSEQRLSLTFFDDQEYHEGNPAEALKQIEILKTPFDWAEYAIKYWWGEKGKKVESVEPQQSTVATAKGHYAFPALEEAIAEGESQFLEYKPAMLFNFKTKKIGYEPKWNVAKTIAGFMNSLGGYLLIGYADNGEAKGLRYDFLLRDHGKDPFDYFRLEFDKLLNDYFPKPAQQFVEGRMVKIKGEKSRDVYVFIVQVRPSTFPVFVLRTEKDPVENTWFTIKKFVYRKTASTQEITDIEDIATYCRHKWPVILTG